MTHTSGAAGEEAYVEAELDLPEELEELGELRPEDEDALVVSRRVFADGRTRAYAWGRAAAREDVAAAVERVVAMSGQFEQRRLAKPSYQLEVLDRFLWRRAARAPRHCANGVARAPGCSPPTRRADRERRARRGPARGAARARRGHRRARARGGGAAARRARAAPARRRARRGRGRSRHGAHAGGR